MRMVVVLPAAFGPRKPKISPFSTLNVTFSIAAVFPKYRVRFSTSINYYLRLHRATIRNILKHWEIEINSLTANTQFAN